MVLFRCDILSENARALAVGSVELLENAKVFETLEECVSDLSTVIATTARSNRSIMQEILSPRQAAAQLLTDSSSKVDSSSSPADKIGIMFGRERDGLNNEELALADTRVFIPTCEHYEVLNLAQAVNIVCYEFWQREREIRDSPDSSGNDKVVEQTLKLKDQPSSREELFHFVDRLGNAIREASGDPKHINESDLNSMKIIFQRAKLTKGEVKMMQGLMKPLYKTL